jgi:uncharacterized protein (TIGR00730 family)
MTPPTRLCVFCGSSPGARPEYTAAAHALGRELAARGIGLVYGGASVGLMGAVADATLAAGGEAIGVIPRSLQQKEIAHAGLSQLHVVASMHERKALMAQLSSGFVALPGGIGTLEELFEAWTWSQLGIHAKPVGLLNVAGYYDALLRFLDHAVAEGFIGTAYRPVLLDGREPAAVLDAIDAWRATPTGKWVDLSTS